ncbi:hypothetical protein MRB53_041734 [Persea americana]|nr:hypothetical protein MRB53_041734 [Persea americana]
MAEEPDDNLSIYRSHNKKPSCVEKETRASRVHSISVFSALIARRRGWDPWLLGNQPFVLAAYTDDKFISRPPSSFSLPLPTLTTFINSES